jgi:hypothetical protein
VAIATAFSRIYRLLANMGLILRDDPPKVIDMIGREWGEAVNGLALSIREIPGGVLSVVIRNSGPEQKTFDAPGWLFFYEIHSDAPLSAYGRELLKPERNTERIEIKLGPGEAKETDLPLAVLYDMRAQGSYKVRVSCKLLNLTSNEIAVRGL